VSSPGPVGHESRPSPSLLATVYLFGIYLSQDPELKHHEKTYFDLSLQHVSRDTSSTTTHPNHRLHVIQTEVLLTHYFFANNRSIEGKYHCYSAYSLAIASGIHKMGARNPPELTLPPAADDIEEGERINAYWAIFCLDKEWAGVFNCNPNITCSASNGIRLVTPMPREIEEYETVCFDLYICLGSIGFVLIVAVFCTGPVSVRPTTRAHDRKFCVRQRITRRDSHKPRVTCQGRSSL
jgi:hypothetical protein